MGLGSSLKRFLSRFSSSSSIDDLLARKKLKREPPVGKRMGSKLYAHRDYIHLLIPQEMVNEAKKKVPERFRDAAIIRYNAADDSVMFGICPDFDNVDEPIVVETATVFADGRVFQRKVKDPDVYHHKWMMVLDDYEGFDIQKAKERSLAIADIVLCESSIMGKLSIWEGMMKRIGDPDWLEKHLQNPTVKPDTDKIKKMVSTAAAPGEERKVHTFFLSQLNPPKRSRVVDFGCGWTNDPKHQAAQVKHLKAMGFENVIGYDFQCPESDICTTVLDRATAFNADFVLVANVLNVQRDVEWLRTTLRQIAQITGNGQAIMGFPSGPRTPLNLTNRMMLDFIEEQFDVQEIWKYDAKEFFQVKVFDRISKCSNLIFIATVRNRPSDLTGEIALPKTDIERSDIERDMGDIERSERRFEVSKHSPHVLTPMEKEALGKKLQKSFFSKGHEGEGMASSIDSLMSKQWRLLRLNPRTIDCNPSAAVKWLKEDDEEYALSQGLSKVRKFPFRDEPLIIGPRRIGKKTFSDQLCAFDDTRYMIMDGYHRNAAAIRDKVPAVWAYVIDLDMKGTRGV